MISFSDSVCRLSSPVSLVTTLLRCSLSHRVCKDKLMKYSLTYVTHCLSTAEGFFKTTNKIAMLHYLVDDGPEDTPYPKKDL